MSNDARSRPTIAEPPLSRPVRWIALAAVTALFAGLRILQLAWRPPFFDELFTVWISRLHPRAMLEALFSDSGPPLYYLAVRALTGGEPTLTAARLVSLGAASALLVAILLARRLGGAALIAALLLAVFAPHVHFSAEARAYALAGALAGAGALALAAWGGGGRRSFLALGTALLVAAATAHYYGVFFFAVPFALGLLARNRRAIAEGAAASAAAGIAFVPGFVLASRQPSEAIAWMRLVGRAPSPLEPLRELGFAAGYPSIFIAPAPVWVQLLALAVTLAVVAGGLRSEEARRWGVIALLPVALAVGFGLAGTNVYFPVRFEAVLAAPLACWLAVSLQSFRVRWLRGALTVLLVALGLFSSYVGIMTSLAKRPDRWREAASFVRRRVPDSIPVVASGYAYLEVLAQKDAAWNGRVSGLPREIESHPGWVGPLSTADAWFRPEDVPPVPFVWLGERSSLEHRALARRYVLRPLLAGRGVVVVEATAR